MLFPDPAKKSKVVSGEGRESIENRTFSLDPQERTRRLPIIVDGAFNQPCGGPGVVRFTRRTVIN